MPPLPDMAVSPPAGPVPPVVPLPLLPPIDEPVPLLPPVIVLLVPDVPPVSLLVVPALGITLPPPEGVEVTQLEPPCSPPNLSGNEGKSEQPAQVSAAPPIITNRNFFMIFSKAVAHQRTVKPAFPTFSFCLSPKYQV